MRIGKALDSHFLFWYDVDDNSLNCNAYLDVHCKAKCGLSLNVYMNTVTLEAQIDTWTLEKRCTLVACTEVQQT